MDEWFSREENLELRDLLSSFSSLPFQIDGKWEKVRGCENVGCQVHKNDSSPKSYLKHHMDFGTYLSANLSFSELPIKNITLDRILSDSSYLFLLECGHFESFEIYLVVRLEAVNTETKSSPSVPYFSSPSCSRSNSSPSLQSPSRVLNLSSSTDYLLTSSPTPKPNSANKLIQYSIHNCNRTREGLSPEVCQCHNSVVQIERKKESSIQFHFKVDWNAKKMSKSVEEEQEIKLFGGDLCNVSIYLEGRILNTERNLPPSSFVHLSGIEGKILMFVSPGCSHCLRAKDLLLSKGQEIFQIDLNKYPWMRKPMVQKCMARTVPQIFLGEKHIGGASDLFALESEGKLDEILKHLDSLPPLRLLPLAERVSNQFFGFQPSLSELVNSFFQFLEEESLRKEKANFVMIEKNEEETTNRKFSSSRGEKNEREMKGECFKTVAMKPVRSPAPVSPERRVNEDSKTSRVGFMFRKMFSQRSLTRLRREERTKEERELPCFSLWGKHEVAILSLVEEMKGRGERRKLNLKIHSAGMFPNSFRGRELLQFIKREFSLSDLAVSLFCSILLFDKYIVRVDAQNQTFSGSSVYQFYDHKFKNVLNMTRPSSLKRSSLRMESSRFSFRKNDAAAIASEMGTCIISLRDRFVSLDGKEVDYVALGKHPLYFRYVLLTIRLQEFDLTPLSILERKTFFLNLYNALVIHATVCVGTQKTALERSTFFGSMSYKIGKYRYTLNDIEHGILRCNRNPPGLFSSKPFANSDPRLKYSIPVSEFDPRIHFALVCGAKSCPPIRVFSSEIVNDALDWATEAFVSEEVSVDVEKGRVKMSMLFKWYFSDFGKSEEEVLKWILLYLSPEKGLKTSFKITYFEYNWDQNGRGEDEKEESQVMPGENQISPNQSANHLNEYEFSDDDDYLKSNVDYLCDLAKWY